MTYLAVALEQSGAYDESADAYREVVRLAGRDSTAGIATRIQLSRVLIAKGEPAAATGELREVIPKCRGALKCMRPVACLQLGHALAAQGDRKGARAAWKRTVRLDRKGLAGEEAKRLLQTTR